MFNSHIAEQTHKHKKKKQKKKTVTITITKVKSIRVGEEGREGG